MKQLSVMIKPVSAQCNMRCGYCFYANVSSVRQTPSFGTMQKDTARRILDNILCDMQPGDILNVAFQGGEPSLAGLDFYRDFVAYARQNAGGVRLQWAFQTNGLVLGDEWCVFFRQHRFLVGLSLDLLHHDENRPDAKGTGTYKRVLAAKQLLKKHDVEYNILCVLTNALARHPAKVWREIMRLGLRYVQFIPCLDELDGTRTGGTLTPGRFAAFYNGLFPLWLGEFEKGNYISIKLFDDVVNLLSGMASACGLDGHCAPQSIVEADGGVYPCDFFVLDQYRAGSLAAQPLRAMLQHEAMRAFAEEKPALPALCATCPYAGMCGGGCKRMRRCMYVDKNGGLCGFKSFLDKNMPALRQVAQNTRRRMYMDESGAR